jgi:hypothetical protein
MCDLPADELARAMEPMKRNLMIFSAILEEQLTHAAEEKDDYGRL